MPIISYENEVKLAARMFEAAGIPVIRLGLNPTEELSEGAAVAGAYHPALGELVRSEVMRRRAADILSGVPAGASVTLGVAPRLVSVMIGQRRGNIAALTEEFALENLKICAVPEVGDRILLIDVKPPGQYTVI